MSVVMQQEHEVHIVPPSRLLMLLEARAVAEYGALLLSRPAMNRLPQGDGHPVLVMPGFGAGDLTTHAMRRLLRRLGYRSYGWNQGRNLGVRDVLWMRLRRRLQGIVERNHGARVSLIGWSLGGIYARELAREWPELVRQVITMGSPINGRLDANNAVTLFRWINRHDGSGTDWAEFQRRREPPPVPCTAIYSRRDGVVAWQCAMEEAAPNTCNIQVSASHLGLGFNPRVMRVLANRLARPESAMVRV